MGTYYTIITCRNSENDIKNSLKSIHEQTLKSEYIIVIDDGSSDNTPRILSDLKQQIANLYIITNQNMGYDITRVPFNYNKAISFIKKHGLPPTDYHLIASDDCIFERNYAIKIISFMDQNENKVYVSGNYEPSRYNAPRGAGRFVRSSYFDKYYKFYPERMGYETVLLYEADMRGYSYSVMDNARYDHVRELGKDHKFRETGPVMKLLGYHPLFVLNRFVVYFISGEPLGRIGATKMLYDYIFYKPHRNEFDRIYGKELREYIRKNQVQQLKKIRFKKTSEIIRRNVLKKTGLMDKRRE